MISFSPFTVSSLRCFILALARLCRMSVCRLSLPACADSVNLLCISRHKKQAHSHPEQVRQRRRLCWKRAVEKNCPCLLWLTFPYLPQGSPRAPGSRPCTRSKAAWIDSDVLRITGLKPEDQAVIVRYGTAAVRLAAFRPTRTGDQRLPAPPAGAAPPGPPAVTPAVRSPLHLLLLGSLVLTMSHLHYTQLLDLFTALILTMFMVFTSRILDQR